MMPESDATAIVRPDWLTDHVWPFTVRTFMHHQQPVHYLDEGTGPTLVFVHAGFWSFVWRDLITELRHDFRCLALDFPGAGLSPGGRHDVDLRSYVTVVNEWLDALDVDDATLVVHDLGGVVGIGAAAARPDRVRALVAVNSFAWPPDALSLRAMLRFMGGAAGTAVLGTLRVIPRLSRTSFGVGRHLDRAGRRAFFGPYRRRSRSRNFHRAMGSARRSPDLFGSADQALQDTLAGRPMLTVFGERNDPFGFQDKWQERFPHAERHVIDRGNHFPMCDDPQLVAGWIRSWHRTAVRELTVT